MKNWSDAKVAFMSLCVIALVIILGLFIRSVVVKNPMSEKAVEVMAGILTLTIGGIITFGTILANKKDVNDKN
jgi:hypothetical protein